MRVKLNAYTKVIIIVSFVISAGLVLFIAFNANNHLANMTRNNSELYSAYRISELMKLFRSNLLVLDNKQKGYVITGDAQFLEEYKLKETQIKTYLESMQKYFSGRQEQKIFFKLKVLTYKKMTRSKDLSQGHNLAGFQGNAEAGLGYNVMEDIQAVMNEIDHSLNQTTKTLIDHSIDYVNDSKKWSVLEVALGVFVLITALLLLLRDVSTRNKLEAELRNAKQLADDNATLKEQFMANMSHEIRTPMNAILGFTDLIQKTPLNATQAEYVWAIKASGANLLNIINDILDFSKIEAGMLMIEKIPFSLTGLVDSLRIMFAEKARQKNIRFEVALDRNIPGSVFGDPTRLTQILVNLVNNAIKFTETGGVKLNCEVKSIEHDMVQMVFRIKDTGIGIPADKLDHIFERFNQGNKETTRKYGGTGLGLSIVKDLVELQNGEIRVKSKQGFGSEFIVNISYPVSYEQVTAPQAAEQLEFPRISENSLAVLLAEDNDLNQKLAGTYLQDFGFTVDVAENGLVAIDKLKQKHYDLVLMDIQMPLLDGYHTAQKIRQELGLNMPVIAMTAHSMPGEREKCIGFGMNDYISKPFKESELYQVVKMHMKQEIKQTVAAAAENKNTQALADNAYTMVNFNELKEMARNNLDFMKEMIGLFLEKNPQDLAELEKALASADLNAVRATAHRMKTSVGFMGLKALSEPLAQIEMMAEQADAQNIPHLFEQVKKDCLLATREFKSFLSANA